LILELRKCDPQFLDDLPYLRQSLMEAAEAAGAHIVGETFHKFSPHGVTGVVAIAESHLCIHTWPEHDFAAADIFTCGDEFKPREAANLIIGRLRCKEPSVMEIRRGIMSQAVGARP
jgi:S-adenosylmethionine decarboxylase